MIRTFLRLQKKQGALENFLEGTLFCVGAICCWAGLVETAFSAGTAQTFRFMYSGKMNGMAREENERFWDRMFMKKARLVWSRRLQVVSLHSILYDAIPVGVAECLNTS